MDTFIEKLVTRKKTVVDHIITALVVLVILLALFFFFMTNLRIGMGIDLLLIVGIIYFGYRLITSRNVEYEYIVTNGDLDIDVIVAKRKRKRIFSANCKEFEIVAPVKSSSFSQQVQSIKNRIDTSSTIDSPDAYFITLNHNNSRTLVIFEPDERMLRNFKIYIPRKVLNG
ncbi:MAG: hypothetical protein GX279_04770 [Clostridiaceae bacterium]|nr:hypothetical protein [Clostridiaceae bacterium]